MYKKISHNIVEEHYDHPAVVPKKVINGGSFTDNPVAPLKAGEALPQYVMNENTMQFRMDARTAWTKWAYSLMNYAVSLNGNLPGTDQVKGRMHKNAVALGDFLIPYYGPTAARTVATALIAIDEVGMHYVDAIKTKRPQAEIDTIVASWQPYIADLAKLLNEMNPVNWPTSAVADMFNNIVLAWQDELKARAKGDILADEIAIDTLNKLVVTGVPDHSGKGYSSLADIFSRGIIAQFPDLFAS